MENNISRAGSISNSPPAQNPPRQTPDQPSSHTMPPPRLPARSRGMDRQQGEISRQNELLKRQAAVNRQSAALELTKIFTSAGATQEQRLALRVCLEALQHQKEDAPRQTIFTPLDRQSAALELAKVFTSTDATQEQLSAAQLCLEKMQAVY